MKVNLFCREAGFGPPLILLHGNGEDGGYFSSQIEYFSRFRHVYAVDTRGHGRSPRGNAPFTISQFADDLYAFMAQGGIPKADILGFSDGGNTALVFALRYPQMVGRLILNGANLYSKGVKPSVQLPIILGYRIASFFAKRSEKAKTNAEILGLMVNCPDLKESELSAINCPTLVIAGSRDMIKHCHTLAIHEAIRDSELIILKGDHFIANKRPAEFNRAVEKFLQEGAH